ncbi:methyltransferase domain-containing protein [Azoarcus indigens]|uniref:Methyltransferase family protein n=1 Tax=Azoarcus indigens TaxID=29545 RepID=A0A4R6DRK1_9RHOO|nr:class I SAM-dependent methyltransferase [Azoarcus indigens]NMG65870.1 methyltransferase domain-containing protein [Azoarcus indigens]TDN47721.1 methyltransferase family protein [Azoarcus indigens]
MEQPPADNSPLAANIIGLYIRHATHWDSRRAAALHMELGWLQRFTALLPPNASVLDIGCGTGQPIARWLLEQGHAVTGVDSSPAMLGYCRSRLPQGEWLAGDMRRLALERRFHGLIAWDSFFHLTADDQRAMFPRFRAHALPGAALLFTSGPGAGEAIGEFEGEPLYHASLAPEEYRTLLAENGFTVLAHRSEDPDCGQHTVWLAQQADA